jgi:hypothetical protein
MEEENVRMVEIENINNIFSFIKIEDDEPDEPIIIKFGFDEWKQIDYYKNRIPEGLLEQWPCLFYMLENYWQEAIKKTPLQEIEDRQKEISN